MLTRLARLETRKKFSISRILFLAGENSRQLDRRRSIYEATCWVLATCARVKSLAWLGLLDSRSFTIGEGRGVEPPAATWEASVGRPSGSRRGINKQRAHTLNQPPCQHCICNQITVTPVTDTGTSNKLYTWPIVSFHWSSLATLTSCVASCVVDSTVINSQWVKGRGGECDSGHLRGLSECRVKFRVLDESRGLKFSYREIKFSKINIPTTV